MICQTKTPEYFKLSVFSWFLKSKAHGHFSVIFESRINEGQGFHDIGQIERRRKD